MSENNSRISTPISILGWVVAVASLGLNYLTYTDNQKQKADMEREKPTFSYDLATYDTKSMPKEVLALKNPIQHNFVISHRSGRSVKGLVLAFKSEGAPISGIQITEGSQGTITVIDPGKLEAQIKRDELLPSQVVKGSVTTAGITKLESTVDASDGTDTTTMPLYSEPSRYNSQFLWFAAFLALLLVFFVSLIFIARPVLRQAGILDEFRDAPGRSSLLVLMIIFALIPKLGVLPDFGAIVDALLAYFVLTNYRNIVKAIESLANRVPSLSGNAADRAAKSGILPDAKL